jgi:hypothetical protein
MPAEGRIEAESQNLEEMPTESSVKHEPEIVIFSWTAPARPFKRRNREFYVTIIAMAAVVGLVLFIAEGVMPVILLASLVFLFYVLSTVEPENIEYCITNRGIKIGDKITEWDFIVKYWFGKRFDTNLLILETSFLPGRLEIVILPHNMENIRKELDKYLSEEEAKPTRVDQVTSWFASRLPGN